MIDKLFVLFVGDMKRKAGRLRRKTKSKSKYQA